MDDQTLNFITIVVGSSAALVGIIGSFLISRAIVMANDREMYLQKGQDAFNKIDKDSSKLQHLIRKKRECEDSRDKFSIELEIQIVNTRIHSLLREVKESSVKIETSHPMIIWVGFCILALCSFTGILLPLISLTWNKEDFPLFVQNALQFYQGKDLKKWLFWDMFGIVISFFIYFGAALFQIFISPKFGMSKKKIADSIGLKSTFREDLEKIMDEADKT